MIPFHNYLVNYFKSCTNFANIIFTITILSVVVHVLIDAIVNLSILVSTKLPIVILYNCHLVPLYILKLVLLS